MRRFSLIFTVFILLFVSSCALYKIDVQQGNVVTQEMLDKLQVNMSAKKVYYIMGTPLVVDAFRQQQRWDYIYSFEKGGKEREQRRISLFFKDNHLSGVDGDVKIGQRTTPSQPIQENIEEEPIL